MPRTVMTASININTVTTSRCSTIQYMCETLLLLATGYDSILLLERSRPPKRVDSSTTWVGIIIGRIVLKFFQTSLSKACKSADEADKWPEQLPGGRTRWPGLQGTFSIRPFHVQWCLHAKTFSSC